MTTTTTPVLSPQLREQMHELYRHLHAHPELSMQEHRTAALIEDELVSLGAETNRCGDTGVVVGMGRSRSVLCSSRRWWFGAVVGGPVVAPAQVAGSVVASSAWSPDPGRSGSADLSRRNQASTAVVITATAVP